MNDKQLSDKAVKSLIDSGNADNEPTKLFIPQLQIEDMYQKNRCRFTEKTIKSIEGKKAKNLIEQYNKPGKVELYNILTILQNLDLDGLLEEREDLSLPSILKSTSILDEMFKKCEVMRCVYQVRFLGSRYYSKENANIAEEKLINILNDLGERDLIKGNLSEMSHLTIFPKGGTFISYLLFDEEGVKYLEDNKLDFYEGGIPSSVDEEI